MLYLRAPIDADCAASHGVPLADDSAKRLERALLAPNDAERARELMSLLNDDPPVANWALDAARHSLGREIASIEDAAVWWSDCLEAVLATSLMTPDLGTTVEAADAIHWRLPALTAKLNDHRRQVSEFDARVEHEKLESLKELAYGASHEINNPLANIAARAQSLLQDESDPERRRKLMAMHRQSLRAHEMIADLMLFARPPKLKLTPCSVPPLALHAVTQFRELAAERQIELSCEIADENALPVMADETQIAVAINAVVVNAIEAVGANGNVRVSVRKTVVDDAHFVEILVRDDGPGISEHVRRHMFDPFFSGREAGRGLGFGLTKCWRIVTDHGGRVVVRNAAEGGAEISLLLPAADCVVLG